MSPIPIIDVFAGPGGLGEGFSSLRDDKGEPVFQISMSIEMETNAHNTLRLRSFVRKIMRASGKLPKDYLDYLKSPSTENLIKMQNQHPKEWSAADREAIQATLVEGDDTWVNKAKERLGGYNGPLILIGGPPCQAYSLVGRARRTRNKKKLDEDVKQTLYKCYLRFIEVLHPTVFVMENVKGILSAKHDSQDVFPLIERDMRGDGYTLHSLVVENPVSSKDYIVQAEHYGIPQARHRVILIGVRNDFELDRGKPGLLIQHSEMTVQQALSGIPKVRSGFTSRNKPDCNWAEFIRNSAKMILSTPEGSPLESQLQSVLNAVLPSFREARQVEKDELGVYKDWFRGRLSREKVLANHKARNHMSSDLERYLFCAAYAAKYHKPAKLYDFPVALLPDHKNAQAAASGKSVIFADRFRVQLPDRCSTTVTSHICKDGHYFIHPDCTQCRSLTVREAARLQTFPDDYYFAGNRTAQYQQVGNAVPPLLAEQIAQVVATYLGNKVVGYFDSVKYDSEQERKPQDG